METPIKDYFDERYGIQGYQQFLIDSKEKCFNKLCMTEVTNADMSIASFGEEIYIKGCKEILDIAKAALKAYDLEDKIFLYKYTYRNYILAANDSLSDDIFLKIVTDFFDNFNHPRAEEPSISAIVRFALVFGDDLIDRAISVHYSSRDSQSRFLVASNEKELLAQAVQEKVAVFELLSYAIKNNTIVPYYQGIHDNKLGKVNKFEALMRVFDANGKKYKPASFMNIAKEMNIYIEISKKMLERALSDFENSKNELTINVTLYDIQAPDFGAWLLDRIEKTNNPQNITIEFVETENYNNNTELYNFLNAIRKLGCKIAVDDFGTGFATYTSIISLKPDIIKIDGEIIKNLAKSEESRIILDSICYMARLIGSKIVAEFVENEEIQKILLDKEIDFSQGFYFAKPKPLTDIQID